MKPDYARKYYAMATDLIDAGMGDAGRLEFILQCLDKNKPLYKTDMIFLESLSNQLESKLERLQKPKPTTETKPEINLSSRTLLSDEHLDRHLDKLDSKKSKKTQKPATITNKSFFRKFFSRKK